MERFRFPEIEPGRCSQGLKRAIKSCLALLLTVVCSAAAQPADAGNWFIYFGNQAIDKQWNWHNEVQHRNYNMAGDLEQLLLRTGIGYNLSENNNNVLLGYGFIHTETYLPDFSEKKETDEHRIFQQFITRQQFGRFIIRVLSKVG